MPPMPINAPGSPFDPGTPIPEPTDPDVPPVDDKYAMR